MPQAAGFGICHGVIMRTEAAVLHPAIYSAVLTLGAAGRLLAEVISAAAIIVVILAFVAAYLIDAEYIKVGGSFTKWFSFRVDIKDPRRRNHSGQGGDKHRGHRSRKTGRTNNATNSDTPRWQGTTKRRSWYCRCVFSELRFWFPVLSSLGARSGRCTEGSACRLGRLTP